METNAVYVWLMAGAIKVHYVQEPPVRDTPPAPSETLGQKAFQLRKAGRLNTRTPSEVLNQSSQFVTDKVHAHAVSGGLPSLGKRSR
jgi:hypothetical protein